jgi:NADH-quinone oxidoreductase subunit J
MQAEFLAAMQILVYVGGVLILITFAVMLTKSTSATESTSTTEVRET